MRRIAFACGLVTLIALTTTLLRGNDVVDATQPANVADVEALLQRIDRLERRVRELEAQPRVANVTPKRTPPPASNWFQFSSPAVPPPVAIPFAPQNNDGVLRADQVKIYRHYQTPIHESRTAATPAQGIEPAQFQFQSGGIGITR
ncbi:MAG TPA: hypothetical protein VM165_25860 [Planctomycetaceae bacterium]|nr:hypothetical protein [Planctomycetaceae bacterium]